MDITESLVCSVAGLGISGFGTPDCVTREIVSDKLCPREHVVRVGEMAVLGL